MRSATEGRGGFLDLIEINTLENVGFQEIAAAFNDAFADYFISIQFTAEHLEIKFAHEDGKLALSVGAFENGQLVGFILHFEDIIEGKKVDYNGRTGVRVAYRGNQLTSKMYEYLFPKLKELAIEKLVLEVINENHSASKIYHQLGFKTIREVECFKGKLNSVPLKRLETPYKIVEFEQRLSHQHINIAQAMASSF